MTLSHNDIRKMIAFWPYFVLSLDHDVQQWYPKDVLLPPYLDAGIEIATFMGKPLQEVINRLREEAVVREDWMQITPDPQSDQEVKAFYNQTDGYIYDGMHNYAGKDSEEGLLWLIDRIRICTDGLTEPHILDYGAGTGTKTLFLTKLGYKVTHADIESATLRFAQWRYQQRSLDIPCINLSHSSPSDSSYDCIICISVVEHVIDAPLLLQQLGTLLKPKGFLICNGSHSCGDNSHIAHLPQNFKYAGERFSSLLLSLGFEPYLLDCVYRKCS